MGGTPANGSTFGDWCGYALSTLMVWTPMLLAWCFTLSSWCGFVLWTIASCLVMMCCGVLWRVGGGFRERVCEWYAWPRSPMATTPIPANSTHAQGVPATDNDLEIQTGILAGQSYSAVFAATTRPGYARMIAKIAQPRPGMVALQRYMQWREAHAHAVCLAPSRR